jgi:type VI secretion system protein ImpK
MNPISSKAHTPTTVDIDSLLQDSYLLVVELRQGASAHDSQELTALCVKQIEYVRQVLRNAGLSQRSIDHISHALCALLDETVLGCAAKVVHADWAGEPLQAKFFNRHQAGEFLYEDMREMLRESAPDIPVLTVFQRILMLGFQGRYRDINDPKREQLLIALSAQVAPLNLGQHIPTQVGSSHRAVTPRRLHSPLAHAFAAGLLLAMTWWGMDHLLGNLITALVPEQL